MNSRICARKAAAFLVLGCCAVSAFQWPWEKNTNLRFETQASKTLGRLQNDSNTGVELPFLSLAALQQRLGYKNQKTFEMDVLALSNRVNGGFLPSQWSKTCAEEHQPQLCVLLNRYFEVEDQMSSDRPARRRRGTPVAIAPKNAALLQQEPLAQLLGRFPDLKLSRLLDFTKLALRHTECPRNLSLVLARELESHFSEAQAYSAFRKLDEHGLQCLKPSDADLELHALRGALFRVQYKEWKGAEAMLALALSAETKREEYRSLYWMRRVQLELGDATKAQRYATELASKFPLSWYSILVAGAEGRDPAEQVLSRPPEPDQYQSRSRINTERVLWLRALAQLGYDSAARRFGDHVIRNLEGEPEVGFLQHLAREMDYEQLYRLQIQALNRFATKQPENISAETLRLLYPKPFFDTIDRHTQRVMDTSLLLGLARQESSFDPYAVSGANARGLLQILPTTARGLTKKRKQADLHDYAQNIELGAIYVTRLASRFGGSFEKALAAYNAGQGNVAKWERRLAMVNDTQLWMDLIPFRETRDYVPSILRNAYWYHRLFPSFSKEWSEAKLTSDLLRLQVALIRASDSQTLSNAASKKSGRDISSPTRK